MKIPLHKLGKSDLQISPLGLGCWQFSKQIGLVGKYWQALTDDETCKIVKTSICGGINWFDTAEIYGQGKSEQDLANALKKTDNSPMKQLLLQNGGLFYEEQLQLLCIKFITHLDFPALKKK